MSPRLQSRTRDMKILLIAFLSPGTPSVTASAPNVPLYKLIALDMSSKLQSR
jgi:hypothetical protein